MNFIFKVPFFKKKKYRYRYIDSVICLFAYLSVSLRGYILEKFSKNKFFNTHYSLHFKNKNIVNVDSQVHGIVVDGVVAHSLNVTTASGHLPPRGTAECCRRIVTIVAGLKLKPLVGSRSLALRNLSHRRTSYAINDVLFSR